MPNSPAKSYRAIPSLEDRANHSGVHEGGDVLYSTDGWIPFEAGARWTYFFLGCATLLPWNALVHGTSFFLFRLAGSPFYSTFSSCLSSVFALTKLVFQFYSTITSKQSSPSRRIFASITAMILLVTSLCLSTFVGGTPSGFFVFALFNAAFLAVSGGYLSTATYATAAPLGTAFLQSVLSGQAAIAVVASTVQVTSSVISLWGTTPKSILLDVKTADGSQAEEQAARIFFGVSVIFLCITLTAYTWLTKQSCYKPAARTVEQHREIGDTDELTRLVADDNRNPQKEGIYQILKRNLIFMFSITYVYTVTLAVFPAITSRVRPVNPGIHPLLFTAVHALVLNTGDLVGRCSCSFPCLFVWSAKKILVMSLIRTVFIPLILLCNVQGSMATSPAAPTINSDILFMVILLTMGYTNGYVSSLGVLALSSVEHNPRLRGRREDVDIAATLGGSFTIVGLASGALCSFGVQAIL